MFDWLTRWFRSTPAVSVAGGGVTPPDPNEVVCERASPASRGRIGTCLSGHVSVIPDVRDSAKIYRCYACREVL